MKKLCLLSIIALTSIAIIYSCSTEEEDTTPPPSVVATPEPEPPAPTQYTLTVTAGEGGSVSTEGGTYDEGTEVTITATPDDGYEFIGWEGSDNDSNSLSITLNGNFDLIANFEEINNYIPVEVFNFSVPIGEINLNYLSNTFLQAAGIFHYTKNGFEYIIVAGYAQFRSAANKESIPKTPSLVLLKNQDGWDSPIIQPEESKMWSARNFDFNDELFVLSDGNEIGDVSEWSGDLIAGTPENGEIVWQVINEESKRAYNHDVSIGDVNGDGVLDVLGTSFNFFLGNNTKYDYRAKENMIDYQWNNPLAFELYDLDNDGIDEIITADYSETFLSEASNRLTIHKRSSNNELYAEVFTKSSQSQFYSQDMGATSFEVHDFNNDGITDIGIAREGEGERSFEIWIGNGDLSYTPYFSKSFNPADFNFQEFEVFDADNDGFLDILLKANNYGGQTTTLFHNDSTFEGGISLNQAIWINNGDATFDYFNERELISPEAAFYCVPYKGSDNKLHYFGFYTVEDHINQNDNTLEVRLFDFTIDL